MSLILVLPKTTGFTINSEATGGRLHLLDQVRFCYFHHDTQAFLLFYLLCGVSEAVVVEVKDGPSEDVDAVVFLGVTPQQRPLQVTPNPCRQRPGLETTLQILTV